MSKRPNNFKKFQAPKKVVKTSEGKTEEDQPTDQPQQLPTPKPQHSAPKNIKPASSSESENDTSGPSRLAQPATGNLVVTNENFAYISKQLNEIHAYVRRRAQVIQNHDSIAEALNQDQTPDTFKISKQLPRPPYGVEFSEDFVKAHRAKVQQYSRRLARGVAEEYKRLAEELKAEIDRRVEAAEGSLFMVIDEEEQRKAIQLFRVKLQSIYRRVNNGTSRRYLKGKRHFPAKK